MGNPRPAQVEGFRHLANTAVVPIPDLQEDGNPPQCGMVTRRRHRLDISHGPIEGCSQAGTDRQKSLSLALPHRLHPRELGEGGAALELDEVVAQGLAHPFGILLVAWASPTPPK